MFQHQRYQLLYFDEVVLPFSKETQFISHGHNMRFLLDFSLVENVKERRTWTVDLTDDNKKPKKEDVTGKLYFLKGREVRVIDIASCLLETYTTDEFYSSFLFQFPPEIEFDKVIVDLKQRTQCGATGGENKR